LQKQRSLTFGEIIGHYITITNKPFNKVLEEKYCNIINTVELSFYIESLKNPNVEIEKKINKNINKQRINYAKLGL